MLNPITKISTGLMMIMEVRVIQQSYGGAQVVELFPRPIHAGRYQNCTAPPNLTEAVEYDSSMGSLFFTRKEGGFKTGICRASEFDQIYKIHKDGLDRMKRERQKDLDAFFGLQWKAEEVAPRKSLAFFDDGCRITEAELKKKKKIYLCGKFSKRFGFKLIRNFLHGIGCNVVSSWIDQEDGGADYPTHRKKIAERDIEDVRRCDIMIVDSEPSTKGGMHFEAGFAYALGKKIVLIGTSDMLFSTLADVQFPGGWTEFYDFIGKGGRL